MSYPYQPQPQPMPPMPAPPKRRHPVRNTFIVLGGLVVAGIIAAAVTGGSSAPPAATAPGVAPVAASSSDPAPAPAPSPDGTYTGSCDYTLGDSPATGTAMAVGEVDVVNTGNIGTTDTVSITWPQEGYAPLAMHTVIKIAPGATDPVSFHRPLSYDQITQLQSWQTGHDYADGCTYNATITGTW